MNNSKNEYTSTIKPLEISPVIQKEDFLAEFLP